jgi:ribosomal subunit interface protein
MKITLLTTNIELEDKIAKYLDKKLMALEKLIDPKDTSALAAVEIERITKHHRKGKIYRAEINLHTAAYGSLRAEGSGEIFEAAIDEMKQDILRELRTSKSKLISSSRSGFREIKRRATRVN